MLKSIFLLLLIPIVLARPHRRGHAHFHNQVRSVMQIRNDEMMPPAVEKRSASDKVETVYVSPLPLSPGADTTNMIVTDSSSPTTSIASSLVPVPTDPSPSPHKSAVTPTRLTLTVVPVSKVAPPAVTASAEGHGQGEGHPALTIIEGTTTFTITRTPNTGVPEGHRTGVVDPPKPTSPRSNPNPSPAIVPDISPAVASPVVLTASTGAATTASITPPTTVSNMMTVHPIMVTPYALPTSPALSPLPVPLPSSVTPAAATTVVEAGSSAAPLLPSAAAVPITPALVSVMPPTTPTVPTAATSTTSTTPTVPTAALSTIVAASTSTSAAAPTTPIPTDSLCTPDAILCSAAGQQWSLCAPISSTTNSWIPMGAVAAGTVCRNGEIVLASDDGGGPCDLEGGVYCKPGGLGWWLCLAGGLVDMGAVAGGTSCVGGVIGFA